MNRLLVSSLIITAAMFLTCNDGDNGITPPIDSRGRQQEIPWPSLADSPWPMNHGNPQSTGRSKYVGPRLGTFDWTFDLYSEASAVISPDFTIYVVGSLAARGLYALSPDGTLKRKIIFDQSAAHSMTPLVGADGTIYVGGNDGKLYAVNPDGTINWTFSGDPPLGQVGINIGLDGTIYFVTGRNTTLYAVNPDGTLKWQLSDSRFYGGGLSAMSFSPDGRNLYVPGVNTTVLAIDVESQTIKWNFGNSEVYWMAPVVDSEGHIYVLAVADTLNSGMPSLFSLNEDGTVRWSYVHNNPFDLSLSGEPTIDIDGNVYFALDTLYSVDYFGNLRWKIPLTDFCDSPLVCDANSTIYLTLVVASQAKEIMAVSSNGNELWRLAFESPTSINHSPALTSDGRLIIPSWRFFKIYSVM